MKSPITYRQQNGAALVVGLILLLILTVFAVSGMSTATLELVLAGNTQFKENAFQAAESAIEVEFSRGPSAPGADRDGNYTFEGVSAANSTTSFRVSTIAEGYSLTGYAADHYIISATGTSGKNARAVNEQGFFVVVPRAEP